MQRRRAIRLRRIRVDMFAKKGADRPIVSVLCGVNETSIERRSEAGGSEKAHAPPSEDWL